jgi:Holliday junction resolvase RusA-like endonuclease
MPLLEFIVPGTPISAGASAKSKAKWRAKVGAAAAAALPSSHALVADPVRATVIYFYVETDLDLDNILKPILDSMNGIVYVDD